MKIEKIDEEDYKKIFYKHTKNGDMYASKI